jgi:pSer/pThr/pTyr-binding forkhead associated (FHA) protein
MPLLVQAGDQSQVFHDRFMVGRKHDGVSHVCADLTLDDEYASPRHAMFYPLGDQWFVEDLGSANGTWVNGISPDGRHVYGPQLLTKGAKVRIGRTVLTVVPT